MAHTLLLGLVAVMSLGILEWIIAGLAGAAAAALLEGVALLLSKVLSWMRSEKIADTDYGVLVKERLQNGNYKVRAGVIKKGWLFLPDKVRATRAWECTELDADLKRRFRDGDKVKVTL